MREDKRIVIVKNGTLKHNCGAWSHIRINIVTNVAANVLLWQ